jgi:hypothetical protein
MQYTGSSTNPSESITVPDYPKSHIPIQPVLSLASFSRRRPRHVPSVLDAGKVRFVTSGRIAIALALQQMKIGKNDKVLVPSYHCSSMVEPVFWAGATPVFYKNYWFALVSRLHTAMKKPEQIVGQDE